MKIIIHSLDELLELSALIDPRALLKEVRIEPMAVAGPVFRTGAAAKLAEAMKSADTRYVTDHASDAMRDDAATTVKPHPEGTAGFADEPDPEPKRSPAEAGLPGKDADGAPYNTDWHSDPAKLTGKDVWRARRGRDEAAYKDWLLSLAVEVAEAAIAADDVEPVATETHALPQDEPETAGDTPEVQAVAETAGDDLLLLHTALIEASQEAAKDAPDGMIDLFDAGKEFIKTYGTKKFDALKAAVAPLEDGKGKPTQTLNPGERRLLRACMDNYALYL